MRTLEIVGIGMGDPAQLTLQAVDAIGRIDVALLLDMADPALRPVTRYAARATIVGL